MRGAVPAGQRAAMAYSACAQHSDGSMQAARFQGVARQNGTVRRPMG